MLRPSAIRLIRATLAVTLFLAGSAAIVFVAGRPFLRSAGTCSPERSQFSEHVIEIPRGLIATGLAWGDYDRDGWDDLFVAARHAAQRSSSRLYRNRAGTLVDVTNEAGLPNDLTASSGFLADYDNDGWPDLFVVETVRSTSRLRAFRNAGGAFTERTRELGLDPIRSESVDGTLTFADFNSDGNLDLVISFKGRGLAYPNLPIPAALKTDIRFGAAAMKLFAGAEELETIFRTETDLAAAIERDFGKTRFIAAGGYLHTLPTSAPGIIPPQFLRQAIDLRAALPGSLQILENVGGSFRVAYHLAATTGLRGAAHAVPGARWPYLSGNFFQPVPLYLPGDDRIDLFVAADFGRNLLLEHERGFQFRDVTAEYSLDIFGTGMGVALGDTRRTGELELVVTNVGRVFRFRPQGYRFALNLNESYNRFGFGWGAVFTDADNDGWPDLYLSNGWPSALNLTGYYMKLNPYPQRSFFSPSSLQDDRFYWNEAGRLTNHSHRQVCIDTTDSLPVAAGDMNRDGAEDLALGTVNPADGRSVTVFKNRGSTTNHFVQIRLTGNRSHSSGVGAIITVIAADGSRQSQLVAIGEGFHAQHSLVKTFGLGTSASPVTVEVLWPSGARQLITDAAVDAVLTIQEPGA